MLKTITVLLVSLLTVAACVDNEHDQVTPDRGTTFEQARQTGSAELTVLYVPAPGFAYQEAGELTGVSVEIMRDFVSWFRRYHGIRLELNFIADEDWQRFYHRVAAAEGGVFGLGNVTITEERRQELAFSPPYLNNVAVLITSNEVPELSSFDDFADHFADLYPLAFAGTLHEHRVRKLRDQYHPDREIARASSNQEIIDRVSAGDHYSYIDAYNFWRAQEAGTPLRQHPIANLGGETFGFIMPHSNDWATLLTAFFAAEGGYRDTPRYRAILEEHLGESLTETLEDARREARQREDI